MSKGKELTKNLVKRESIDSLTRWPEKTKSFLFLFWYRYQHRFTWKVWAALFVVVFGGVGFLATWQLFNMQKSPNCPKIFWPVASASLRLYCAQLSADSRTVAGLLEAIALVEALPEDHPLRSQVNQQVEEWARDILNLAEKDYQAGNLEQAIAKARQIPNNMAVAAIIEERIAKWQGTWTEGNAFGVITDEATHVRFYVGHSSALAKAAILDPELTLGLPPKATAATGMDAMIHAVESYLSIRNNPYSDGIALQTIELVMKNLPTAYKDGSNLEARANMLLASHIVGVGFSHTGLGLVHGIGHSLGGHFNVPHGVALCTVLEEVLRYNLPTRQARMAKIGQALGVSNTAKSEAENADLAIKALVQLASEVGLDTKLSDHGITEADLPLLAKTAVEDAVTLNNPIKPTEQDVLGILRSAL